MFTRVALSYFTRRPLVALVFITERVLFGGASASAWCLSCFVGCNLPGFRKCTLLVSACVATLRMHVHFRLSVRSGNVVLRLLVKSFQIISTLHLKLKKKTHKELICVVWRSNGKYILCRFEKARSSVERKDWQTRLRIRGRMKRKTTPEVDFDRVAPTATNRTLEVPTMWTSKQSVPFDFDWFSLAQKDWERTQMNLEKGDKYSFGWKANEVEQLR